MLQPIREADWKVFRKLRVVALERYCDSVLTEIGQTVSEPGKSSNERYLAVFQLLRKRDEVLADMFDDPRRSVALDQLVLIHSHRLLTDEEFLQFSPETREAVEKILDIMRG